MRRLILLTFVTLAVSASLFASDRHQSYFTYDDGGTIVRSTDGREIEARVNLPLFPGDEVITGRRGRAEIRLADGNVIAIDRASAVRFLSIRDSYEGEETSDTVVQLRYGHVAVLRTEGARETVRLDTENASYIATDESIYAVDTDRGRDRVSIFDGYVEVRTPQRTTRLRSGEEVRVDDGGVFDAVRGTRAVADDFERWFLRRAERYGGRSSRYLDRSLAYAEEDLSGHGSWVYASGYGSWVWRPYVSVGWRPYYYGRWSHGPSGALIWVSYEPWGWVPYHYGRWAHDPFYGWVWLPGTGYSPAWVYWLYGPSYIGWAPAGWWDCYRPYYNWCYRPYTNAGIHHRFGIGFYGRIRVNEVDLRPWTFVTPDTIVSNRVDRAALTTDAIRDRLTRGGGGVATVSTTPARFTREEMRDPASAVNVVYRRGLGGGTGREGTGSPADMTPFFRRDPELSNNVRDRVIRGRGIDPQAGTSAGVSPSGGSDRVGRGETFGPSGGGVIRRGGSSGDAPDRSVTPRGNTGQAGGTDGGITRRGEGGTINRGVTPRPETPSGGNWRDGGGITRRGGEPGQQPDRGTRDGGGISRRGGESGQQPESGTRDGGDRDATPTPWRGRVARPAPEEPAGSDRSRPETSAPRDDSWRGRAVVPRAPRDSGSSSRSDETPPPAPAATPRQDRGSDVPRRIIDRIGGARISPGGDRGSQSSGSGSSGSSAPRADAPAPRSSPPPSSPPPERSSSDSGGRVKRDP